MDQQKKDLAARLRNAREQARLSIAEVAESVGVQPIAVRRWESGAVLPSLLEFRQLLPLYGVMASDILYPVNSWRLNPNEAGELARAARGFSPSLRTRVDILLAMHATGVEPVWKTGTA